MQNDIVEQNKEIISVGELNRSAKYLLEDAFANIAVIGEISNMSRPSSGHIYFTLKDEDGAIGCAMWRSQASKLNFRPEDGDKCILKGQVSLYPATGRYQLMVKSIEQAGSGNLMHQFEQLKKKLDSEGLFDLSNKLSIPQSPKHIGVITSSSTAAFQLQLMNSVGCSDDSIQTIVVANNDAELTGFQFALKYELASQSISSALVESPLIGSWGAGNYNISNDSVVRISWFSVTPNDFNQGDTLVSIRFANPNASLNTASIDSSIMAVEFLNNTATLIPWSISDSLLNCLEIGCTFLNSQCAGQSRTDSIKVQINNSNFSFVYFDGARRN